MNVVPAEKIVNAILDRVKADREFIGFHSFPDAWGSFGRFEVYFRTPMTNEDKPGYYWWACFEGCLPDGEPNGPFPTAEGAYLDAIGD